MHSLSPAQERQSSAGGSTLKQSPFMKRIEDIRAGRVDRNYHRWVNNNMPLRALVEDY